VHWKLKAAIQNTVSVLPSSVSYATYYWVQRHFGGLRRLSPVERLVAGIDTWKRIQEQGVDPTDRVFFEVGTGWAPTVPLAYWLMGARRTITIDINPYLKTELVREILDHIRANTTDVRALFGALLHQKRLDDLLQFATDAEFSLARFLDLCCIEHIAPGDAARTGLPARSVDFHTSYTVLEHIPPEVLSQILDEGNRIVRADGLFVHRIDYSDHFSHSDRTISSINFLQYSEATWARYAGNRFMYMNRLRHDDFLALFQSAGHRIVAATPSVDQRALQVLGDGSLRLSERFTSKARDVLSIRGSWLVSQKNDS
jgi:hypothetical protein